MFQNREPSLPFEDISTINSYIIYVSILIKKELVKTLSSKNVYTYMKKSPAARGRVISDIQFFLL